MYLRKLKALVGQPLNQIDTGVVFIIMGFDAQVEHLP